jgi:hypothetical protein
MLLGSVSCIMSSGKMYIYWSIEVFDFAQLRNREEEFDDYNAQRFAQQIAKSGYR